MTFTENKLIKLYRNGEVNLCSWKNRKVYSCQLNAYDSGFEIFDINCQKLGGCYYQTNNYPEMCEELTNCQTLYRTDKNIWGRPPVVYGSGTPTEKEEE